MGGGPRPGYTSLREAELDGTQSILVAVSHEILPLVAPGQQAAAYQNVFAFNKMIETKIAAAIAGVEQQEEDPVARYQALLKALCDQHQQDAAQQQSGAISGGQCLDGYAGIAFANQSTNAQPIWGNTITTSGTSAP